MLFGTLLMALGVNLFLQPAAVFSGGIPGMSVVVLHILGTDYTPYFGVIVFSLQTFFIVIQIPYFGLGKTIKGIGTSLSFSAMTQLTISPLAGVRISDDLLLMSLGGSACLGFGISIVLLSGYRFVGSLGIAEILSEKRGIPPARSILFLDSTIVICGAWIIGIEQALVSIIGIAVMSQVIGVLTRERFQYRKLLIVTSRTADTLSAIKQTFFQGSEEEFAANCMLRKADNMIVVVLRIDQVRKVKQLVLKYDTEAILVLSELLEKGAKGFARL